MNGDLAIEASRHVLLQLNQVTSAIGAVLVSKGICSVEELQSAFDASGECEDGGDTFSGMVAFVLDRMEEE